VVTWPGLDLPQLGNRLHFVADELDVLPRPEHIVLGELNG
jgi:hypothetical protein